MASNEVKVNVDARKAMQKYGPTLQIHIRRRGDWKIKLGLKIIQLGAWICGLKSEIDNGEVDR